MGPNHVLRRCVMEEEIPNNLRESDEGLVGGHVGPMLLHKKFCWLVYGG